METQTEKGGDGDGERERRRDKKIRESQERRGGQRECIHPSVA